MHDLYLSCIFDVGKAVLALMKGPDGINYIGQECHIALTQAKQKMVEEKISKIESLFTSG